MSRTLLLIDERCTACLDDTVARIGASHVTVVAVPRLPAMWQYAPLSGHVTINILREEAVVDAQQLAHRAALALAARCSVEHRVLAGWRDVIGVLQQGAFDSVVLGVRPGRRARRAITAAGLAYGTALVAH
jgi:hypothetical protein